MKRCLLDTGPLVALLVRSEPQHAAVRQAFSRLRAQLVTTGAVLTEAFYFLAEIEDGPASLASFLELSAAEVFDTFSSEALATAAGLMTKYRDTPMDFPDATLVWTAEQTGTEQILTLDRRGFSTYRFGKSRRFKLLLD